MSRLQNHLRQTFLAGILAAIPLGITAFILWRLWDYSARFSIWMLSKFVPERILNSHPVSWLLPLCGIAVAVGVIYALGLSATSLVGKFFLGILDSFISRIPVLRQLYAAWKQIALTPGGTEGVFSRVCLVNDCAGHRMLGFTHGRSLDGDANTIPVLVLSSPNPTVGRLIFVAREQCTMLDVSTEEAFKIIISAGNYVPPAVGAATALPKP